MALEACLQLSTVGVCRRETIASHLHRVPSKGPASGISSQYSSLLLSFLAPQRRWRQIHLACCSKNAVDEVIAVDDAGWDNAVAGAGSGGSLVLVQFWAPLCGPCSMIEPVISELAKDYAGKLACYKVNTDASPNIATMCGVRSIPTLLFFKNGEKKESIIGAMPKAALRETIDKHLAL